jgi:CHAT domain-containing protein
MKYALLFAILVLWGFYACRQTPPAITSTSSPAISPEYVLAQLKALQDSAGIDPEKVLELQARLYPDTAIQYGYYTDSLAQDRFLNTGKELILTNRFEEAKRILEIALYLAQLHPEIASVQINEIRYRLALAYASIKDYDIALSLFHLIDSSLAKTGSDLPFKARLRIGESYLKMKELTEAQFNFMSLYEDLKKATLPESSNWILSDLFSGLSSCTREIGDLKSATDWGETGNKYVKLPEKNSTIPASNVVRMYTAAGNAWLDSVANIKPASGIKDSKAFLNAEDYFKAALDIYTSNKPPDNQGIITASGNLGELYRRAGLYEKADAVLEQAIKTFSDKPEKILLAQLYVNLGESQFDQDKLPRALACFDTALFCLAPQFKADAEHEIPPQGYSSIITDRSDMLVALGDLAHAHLTLYERAQAPQQLQLGLAAYDSMLVLLNVVRGGFITEESKIELAKRSRHTLQQAFEWYLKLYNKSADTRAKQQFAERAFSISEQSKAFALLESARVRNFHKGGLSGALEKREQALLHEIAQTESELLELRDNSEAYRLKQHARSQKIKDLTLLQKELRGQAPAYYAERCSGANLAVSDMQRALIDEDQSIVEYFCGDEALCIFYIDRYNFKLTQIPIGKDDLNGLVSRHLNAILSKDQAIAERDKVYQQTGFHLFQILLPAIDTTTIKRLILIPDGPLNRLSFETLVTDTLPIPDLQSLVEEERLLVFRYALSYCFSANLLKQMQDKKIPSGLSQKVAVFAPGYNDLLSRQPNQHFSWAVDLKPMGSPQKKQLDGIVAQADGAPFEGPSAGKKQFLEACTQFEYVQVIAHGFLDDQDPNANCVVFDQRDQQLNTDNILFLKSLYANDVNVELAGFSACQTATGPLMAGEGTKSMARGLAYAGARSLLTTCWSIETDGVALFMPDFYKRLLKGWTSPPKDLALAAAKRNYLHNCGKDLMRPANWAGIVLIGATENRHTSQSTWWLMGFLFVGCLALLATMMFKQR